MEARPQLIRPRHSGAALIMTLITLSIMVLLLVGFLSTMLTERRAAGAFEDTQRAKLIAQGAVSHAIDLLRTNIPEPARLAESPALAPAENWAINPGRLTVIRENAAPQYIPLHTGEVTSEPDAKTPRDAESIDLNQPLPGQTVPAITGLPDEPGAPRPPMRVRWVNLLRDPAKPADAENRLIGRYAFWMDDECARLNFNTALGKPKAGSNMFGEQLAGGFVTPLYTRGDGSVKYSGAGTRQWALGRPQSVNLDLLFDQPSQLRHDKLLAHTFLHGFARYPEAIMDFIDVPSARDWYAKNQFQLTFYNRSPEFNAFGKSRFFTTFVPLSTEAGPSYQHPFVHDPSGAYRGNASEILHLNSLLGTFGFTSAVSDDDGGGTIVGGNVINRAQLDMLLAYFKRRWPGYLRSFWEKYGEAECRQIALNALLLARMATTTVGNNLPNFSRDWSYRSTSVNYAPESDELQGRTPERFYWRFKINGRDKLMLPQTPGPHITEVRLFTKAVPADPAPKGNPALLAGITKPIYVQYWYEVEYYMHPVGPVVDIAEFPVRMDYLDILANGGGQANKRQQFGPTDAADNRAAKNWNTAANLARLATLPEAGTTLGPAGAAYQGAAVPNRRIVRSPVRYLGQRETVVPIFDGGSYGDWDPLVFDAAKGGSVSVEIRFRPGMGVLGAPGRPRQMIPLGEAQADTLKAKFQVDLQQSQEIAFSWQINDPRLSHDLKQWEAIKEGPDAPTRVGTPGLPNKNEPAENSSERSKYRYIQRAPDTARLAGYALDREDEYNTAGRVASPGYWSLLHTGMQALKPWQTLDFSGASPDSPPDWLLLDLFGATYPMAHDQWKIDSTLPDEFSTPSFMNSTAGQVNLNSRIYPQTPFFRPPERRKPLEAVFKNLRADAQVKTLVEKITDYQSDTEIFDYVGELSKVPGFSAGNTQWDRESLLRNMAGCLTTRSNTFGVWGVSQVVKKVPQNKEYDRFERGDQVMAEKRFYALVERYVWAGRDGVPGNAHLEANGRWDRLAQQRAPISTSDGITDTLFQLPGSPPLFRNAGQERLNLDPTGSYPEFDGPERVGSNPYTEAALGKVRYRASSLEEAYNPPQPAIKYRVVYFKYLDQ